MSTVKHSSDIGALAREQDGYVPIDDEDRLEEDFDISEGSCMSFRNYYKETHAYLDYNMGIPSGVVTAEDNDIEMDVAGKFSE